MLRSRGVLLLLLFLLWLKSFALILPDQLRRKPQLACFRCFRCLCVNLTPLFRWTSRDLALLLTPCSSAVSLISLWDACLGLLLLVSCRSFKAVVWFLVLFLTQFFSGSFLLMDTGAVSCTHRFLMTDLTSYSGESSKPQKSFHVSYLMSFL